MRIPFMGMMALLLALSSGCGGHAGEDARVAGIKALERGDAAASLPLFEAALAAGGPDKTRAQICNLMGVASVKLGNRSGAVNAFKQAVQIDPACADAFLNLGILIVTTRDDRDAEVCLGKAAGMDTRDTCALEWLAYYYQRRRQWNDASQQLAEAERRAPHSPRILTARALLELRTGNVAHAVACLQRALELDAQYPAAIYNLAVISGQWLNSREDAAAYFQKYVSLVPAGPYADKAREALGVLQTDAPLTMVVMSDAPPSPVRPGPAPAATPPPPLRPAATGPLVTPAETPGGALPPEVTPASPLPEAAPPAIPTVVVAAATAPPTFDELMDIARKQESRNRPTAAINYLRAAREAARANRLPLYQQALQAAERACASDPAAHYAVGAYFAEQRRYDEAIDHFQQALAANTNLHSARLALAGAALDAGEWDTAVVNLKQADQMRPEQPEAVWLLARLYDRQLAMPDKAIDAYTQFERRFPNDSRADECRQRIEGLRATRSKRAPASPPAGAARTNAASRHWWSFRP